MPLFHAIAELRRVHRDAEWVVAGLLIEGRWFPALLDIEPASVRLMESGLVERHPLMPVIAPDLRRAVKVCRDLARPLGADARTSAGRDVLRGAKTWRMTAGNP